MKHLPLYIPRLFEIDTQEEDIYRVFSLLCRLFLEEDVDRMFFWGQCWYRV